jgi:flagellar assembly factor FliW
MTILETAPPVARVRPAGAAPPAPALPLLALTEPMPGFAGHRDYALVAADLAGRLHWLQSVAADGPRFLTATARVFFPEYAPVLPRAVRTELGLAADDVPELYCLLTVPGGDPTAATANLRAPLVVNAASALARQVVLTDVSHPIRRCLRR